MEVTWKTVNIISILFYPLKSTDNRHVVEAPVVIGSFNIQRFGHSKMSDPQVVDVLTKIVCRYDILLVLEIVDTSGVALKDLLHRVSNQTE